MNYHQGGFFQVSCLFRLKFSLCVSLLSRRDSSNEKSKLLTSYHLKLIFNAYLHRKGSVVFVPQLLDLNDIIKGSLHILYGQKG